MSFALAAAPGPSAWMTCRASSMMLIVSRYVPSALCTSSPSRSHSAELLVISFVADRSAMTMPSRLPVVYCTCPAKRDAATADAPVASVM